MLLICLLVLFFRLMVMVIFLLLFVDVWLVLVVF